MPMVHDILREKTESLVCVDEFATVAQAVQAMNDRRIGAVMVLDDNHDLVGMFTERDVLRRIVAREENPREVLVHQVMSRLPITCTPETDLDEVAELMQSRRIRHLPVLDEQRRLIGIISIGDINAFNVMAKQATINNLSDYICGRS